LQKVIADQAKISALGIDGGLYLLRTVFEVKDQMAGYPVAASYLGDFALRDGNALQSAEHKKAVKQSLLVTDSDWRRQCHFG